MINNASNRTLNNSFGSNLPNVGSALVEWFQPMTFAVVTKTTIAFQVVETKATVNFKGVWQPLNAREISYKPEGQRSFAWFRCHSDPSLTLKLDDVVTKDGVQYRVQGYWPWDEYGYREYHLIQDYTGKGPEEAAT